MSVPTQQALAQLAATRGSVKALTTQDFTYTMVFQSVASITQGATAQLLIDSATDFLIVSRSFVAIDDVTQLAVTTAPLVNFNDSSSSSNLFNTPTPAPNVFGNGQLPSLLPMPRLFGANATITGTLNAQITANATTYYFSFMGIKIWK